MFKGALAVAFPAGKLYSFVEYISNIGNETARNLRDIFPVQESDKDFTVITSAERAQASQRIIDQERQTAAVEQYFAHQSQTQDTQSTTSTGGTRASSLLIQGGGTGALPPGIVLNANGDGTVSTTGRATIFGYRDSGDNGIGTAIPGTNGLRYNTNNPDIIGIAVPFKEDGGVRNAIYDGYKGGDLFLVQVPGQPPAIMPIVDNGPATWTGNASDFTYGAAQMNGFATRGDAANVTVRPLTPSEAATVTATYPTLYTGRAGSAASQQAASLVNLTAPAARPATQSSPNTRQP